MGDHLIVIELSRLGRFLLDDFHRCLQKSPQQTLWRPLCSHRPGGGSNTAILETGLSQQTWTLEARAETLSSSLTGRFTARLLGHFGLYSVLAYSSAPDLGNRRERQVE